jgi:hypothetical protein
VCEGTRCAVVGRLLLVYRGTTHIGSRFRRASGSDRFSSEGHRKLFRTRSLVLGSLKGGANGVIALLNGKGQEFESPTPVFSP